MLRQYLEVPRPMANKSQDTIQEGKAKIILPKNVFYNKMARFSRSMAIPIIIYESILRGKPLVVADALAASGVRGIRYYLESEAIDKIVFNDKSYSAYKTIYQNVCLNEIDSYEIFRFDANTFLSIYGEGVFDFIDIDPFGSPSPFIETAVRCIRNEGIVAITATDLTALCGLYPRSAFRKYGAVVYKTGFCHEIALRLLIRNVVEAAGRQFKIASPVISYFSEQYARVYLRVRRGKLSFPYDAIGYIVIDENKIDVIEAFKFDGVVEGTVVGPLWIGPLHDPEFVKNVLERNLFNYIGEPEDRSRAAKLFKIFLEEWNMPPYFYNIHKMCKKIEISPPPVNDIIEKLKSLGYKASRTHFTGYGIKTDSSSEDLLDVLRDLGR